MIGSSWSWTLSLVLQAFTPSSSECGVALSPHQPKAANCGTSSGVECCFIDCPYQHLKVFLLPGDMETYSFTVIPSVVPPCSQQPRERKNNSYLRPRFWSHSPRLLLSSEIAPCQVLLKLVVELNLLNLLWSLIENLDAWCSQSWKKR